MGLELRCCEGGDEVGVELPTWISTRLVLKSLRVRPGFWSIFVRTYGFRPVLELKSIGYSLFGRVELECMCLSW